MTKKELNFLILKEMDKKVNKYDYINQIFNILKIKKKYYVIIIIYLFNYKVFIEMEISSNAYIIVYENLFN